MSRAKIIDFGIARAGVGGETVLGGLFAGKYNFVSPEQLGLFGGEIGEASDIYSLGLVIGAALGALAGAARTPAAIAAPATRPSTLDLRFNMESSRYWFRLGPRQPDHCPMADNLSQRACQRRLRPAIL